MRICYQMLIRFRSHSSNQRTYPSGSSTFYKDIHVAILMTSGQVLLKTAQVCYHIALLEQIRIEYMV